MDARSPDLTNSADFVTLARVLKTQGLNGEVAVALHTVVPDRFHPGFKLFALDDEGSTQSKGVRRELEVESLWPHKGSLILKFVGIDSISTAEELVACELQVPWSARAPLDSGWNYISDLVGCVIFAHDANGNDSEIGAVQDVQFGAGEAPLLIVKSTGSGKGYEIPYAEAYLKSVNLEHKRIEMQLPQGLLELNEPLTAEEKQSQIAEGNKGKRQRK